MVLGEFVPVWAQISAEIVRRFDLDAWGFCHWNSRSVTPNKDFCIIACVLMWYSLEVEYIG
jgi:hypothetical protein